MAEPTTPESEWVAEVRALADRRAPGEPAAVSRDWLGLVERLPKLGARDLSKNLGLGETPTILLMAAFPPPEAWPELVRILEGRPVPRSLDDSREFGFRLLASILGGDRTTQWERAREFEEALSKADPRSSRRFLQIYRGIDDALLAFSQDPEAILAGLERRLSSAERRTAAWGPHVEVPDLVVLLGEEKAEPILRRLLLSKVRVRIEGASTLALARKLALAHVNELQVPRWELAMTMETDALFEALDRKFAPKAPETSGEAAGEDVKQRIADLERGMDADEYEKRRAATYYLMSLVSRGKLKEAAAFAQRADVRKSEYGMESAAVTALERAGYVGSLDDFLHGLLSRNGDLPYWRTYFRVAAKAGTTDRMLTLARDVATRAGTRSKLGKELRGQWIEALLAADKVDEAVAEIRKELESKPAGDTDEATNVFAEAGFEGPDSAVRLARIGVLLERPEWVEAGLNAALRGAGPSGPGDYLGSLRERQLTALLVATDRHDTAEKRIVEQYARAIRNRSTGPEGEFGGHAGFEINPHLLALLELYHARGRHADVLTLFEKSPDWEATDLIDLANGRSVPDFDLEEAYDNPLHRGSHVGKFRLGSVAAEALRRAGRTNDARRVVNFLLNETPEDDRAYELFLEVAGDGAVARLDQIFAKDPFQERPLIWKASLLAKAGQWEEAERTARRAIAIDPSDGEQGKGDRMRVYSVLADIREARGDAREAAVLRGAIRAIRMSERADDFFAAGLLTRAVAMYRESLKHFTDAYCIQSRLAVQLSDLGQHDLAAVHYQKAFELMPDSFGRIESHCFGCERTFDSAPAQSVAERVFVRLAREQPTKPQVHYLLGYLRQQQGKGMEAIPHYREAVRLDPDYLNAWVRLQEVGGAYRLSTKERDDVALQIHRLDPRGKHARADLAQVADLRRLWAAVEASRSDTPPSSPTLLPLPASKEAVERRRTAGETREIHPWARQGSGSVDGAARTPGAAIGNQKLVASVLPLIFGADQGF